MALGATTYKTTNIINLIGDDLTSKEGCGLVLQGANTVNFASGSFQNPYGVLVTGTDSLTHGTYPSPIGDASLELVDQIGCCVQAIAGSFAISVGDAVVISESDNDGSFANAGDQPPAQGSWIWGFALTEAGPGEQFLMRFQPQYVWYIAP